MIRASSFATLVAAAVLLAGCDTEPLAPVRNEEPTTPVEPGTPLLNTTPWFSSDTSSFHYDRPDWMNSVPDERLVSEMSIPGTHESMARFGGELAECQKLTLKQQLEAGIRAFDVRLRHARDSLFLYHADVSQRGTFDENVLEEFRTFLAHHPKETVIMRVQETGDPTGDTQTFAETIARYMSEHMPTTSTDADSTYASIVWQGDPARHFDGAPSLGEVRGKIVILQQFDPVDSQHDTVPKLEFGIPYDADHLKIEDNFQMGRWKHSFDAKWETTRDNIAAAMTDPAGWYLSFTSGAMVFIPFIAPWEIANGAFVYSYAPFIGPQIYVDGMNVRTYRYLTSCYGKDCAPRLLDDHQHGRVGMIMSDFPGPGLIDAIIAENGLPRVLANDPPVAVAGGPYVANEGTPIVFDASASSDPEHDPLQYRWDVDGDSVYDTPWSSDPTATHTWFDEYQGIAQVEVTDSGPSRAVNAVADVTVLNVAPDVVIDSVSTTVPGYLLPGDTAEIHGSFTDPGYLDTHTALWRFGDQATLTGTLVETNEPPEAQGTVTDPHVYGAPGLYSVALDVLDDDGGLGADTTQVHVLSAAEALQFIDGYIRALPDAAFRGPADNRKNALSNSLAAVRTMITEGNVNGALDKLRHDIRAKFDGSVDGKPQDDWIVDPASQQQLCLMLDDLMSYMEGPYWNAAQASP